MELERKATTVAQGLEPLHDGTADTTCSYPLSPMQQGMLFETIQRPQSGVNVEQIVIGLPEKVDPATLLRAWQRIADRHAVLRTRVVWDAEMEPMQEVCAHTPIPFELHD